MTPSLSGGTGSGVSGRTGGWPESIGGIGWGATGLAVDANHMYWTDGLYSLIGRANLDGTGQETAFITASEAIYEIAVDAEHIYWTHSGGNNAIGRAHLDGSSVEDAWITPPPSPNGIAVDSNYVYWTGAGTNTIGRANLDGSSPDNAFITLLETVDPTGLAITSTHLFWTVGTPDVRLGRASLDGSNLDENFLTIFQNGLVAVDSTHVYWTSFGSGAIGRANLDGTGHDDLWAPYTPIGIAVDDNYVYYVMGQGGTFRLTKDGQPADVAVLAAAP